mgnify:FL=1
MSKILAIDPGTERSAWCELEDGKPIRWATQLNADVLDMLRGRAWNWRPPQYQLAIEGIASYGMAVGREVFETCMWIGRFREAWENRHGVAQIVYRREVKLFHCENARANDANIRAAIIDRFGPGKDVAIGRKASPGPLFGVKGDEWSALAIALTAAGLQAGPANSANNAQNSEIPGLGGAGEAQL